MSPFEIRKIKDDINRLKEQKACARQELQFSGHKDKIREYIKDKETNIQKLEKELNESKK
jgi:hypothetical protein